MVDEGSNSEDDHSVTSLADGAEDEDGLYNAADQSADVQQYDMKQTGV